MDEGGRWFEGFGGGVLFHLGEVARSDLFEVSLLSLQEIDIGTYNCNEFVEHLGDDIYKKNENVTEQFEMVLSPSLNGFLGLEF